MKILVVCQYYAPEPFRISDICEALVERGHDVTVVTGVPNYPMGQIYDGYKNGQRRYEEINGVKVHRTFTIGRKSGAVYRFLNYYSYMFSSCKFVKKLPGDFDVVFVNQLSPVMMAEAGIKYKKLHGTKLVLYCLDLWPASLAAGGIGKGSPIYKYFHRVSERIYKSVDKLLVTSKSFCKYFEEEFGMDASKIEYLPQYAEELFSPEACHKEPNGILDLMFAGNVGAAQSVDTIIKAAAQTKDCADIRWHIVGDGSELENCKKLAGELELSNVIFHGRKPLEEMPKYYSMADAMLVTMEADEILSMTLPGKVQTYMAAGKAIIGAINGETQDVIAEAGCGVCVAAGDYMALAEVVRELLDNQEIQECGTKAKAYYKEYFTKESYLEKLASELLDLGYRKNEAK